jgi:hypothetical protein
MDTRRPLDAGRLGLAAVLWAGLGASVMAQRVDPPSFSVLLLHFEEDAGPVGDSSGTGASGTNHGAATGAEGKFGRAYSFDGVDDYLDLGDNFGHTYCYSQQTIEFWLRPASDATSSILGSVEHERGGSWRWYFVRNDDRTVSFHQWDNSRPREQSHQILTSQTTVPAGVWTHRAVTIDSIREQRMALFVNGEQEASAQVGSNQPHGRLVIGAGHQGCFGGSIDELAVFDAALGPAEIRDHATRKEPLPDDRAFRLAEPRLYLRPWGDYTDVLIQHPAFPKTVWRLQVTEWGYRDMEAGSNVRARDVVWTADAQRRHLRYHWGAPDDLKQKVGLDFSGELIARGNTVEFEITVRNVGDAQWTAEPMQLVCLRSGRSPAFRDYEALRTWVRRNGSWVTVNSLIDGKFADHRMCGFRVSSEGDERIERLSAKTSADGAWALGLAVDRAQGLSFNFQEAVSCIHSNPSWGLLEPGEEATAHGRVYLVRGGPDDLYERYLEDFAQPDQ